MTPKQKLQRDRAWFKFQLSSLYNKIDLNSLTPDERLNWQMLIESKNSLLANFEYNSKQLGLNIPEHRCWCGKAAKCQLEEALPDHGYWVCRKHSIK